MEKEQEHEQQERQDQEEEEQQHKQQQEEQQEQEEQEEGGRDRHLISVSIIMSPFALRNSKNPFLNFCCTNRKIDILLLFI